MKKRNPRFGYRRIAMQISSLFDIQIDKDVILEFYRLSQKNTEW